jgi:hypothetical protein
VIQLVRLALHASGTAGITARHFQLIAYNLVVGLIYMEKYSEKNCQFFFGHMKVKKFLYEGFAFFLGFIVNYFQNYFYYRLYYLVDIKALVHLLHLLSGAHFLTYLSL